MGARDTGLDASFSRKASSRWIEATRTVASLTILGAVAFVAGNSQVPQYNGGLPGVERSGSGFPGLPENANPRPDNNRALRDSMNKQEDQKRLKALNVQRQKDMNTDTGKLITLANEIKAETHKADGKESLSAADLRKVEMIEKLARNVREKMTASITVE